MDANGANEPGRTDEFSGVRYSTPTGSICAFCGGQVVYNGNYFCENLHSGPVHMHYAAEEDEDVSDMVAEVYMSQQGDRTRRT